MDKEQTKNPADEFSRQVLFEDNHLLVVIKPAGLLVQGDSTGRTTLLDLAKNYIKEKYHKPGQVFLGLVHRLDRQASGVIVLARTSKAASRLSAQFRDRTIDKRYWAVVHGALSPEAGISSIHLFRKDNRSVPVEEGRPSAQKAELEYKTLSKGDRSSLVEITLLTGRKHQIRAQMAALGCPILGDLKYGAEVKPIRDSIALFSRVLVIRHPTRGETLRFEAEPPADWPWLPLR